nr:hypothetical protein [Tanacetum cinerariifolium]
LELKGCLINDEYADLVKILATLLILLVFLMLVFTNTTNGHQFTMSNRHERIGYSKANGNWCTGKLGKGGLVLAGKSGMGTVWEAFEGLGFDLLAR